MTKWNRNKIQSGWGLLLYHRRYWLFLTGFWFILHAASVVWNLNAIENHAFDMAMTRSKNTVNLLEIMTHWNARHGGVFVANDKMGSTNIQGNDDLLAINQNSGSLQLVTVPDMLRTLSEQTKKKSDIRFHLVSMEGTADTSQQSVWEKEAMAALMTGLSEWSGLVRDRDEDFFRYMSPLVIHDECLSCHAGEELGKIKGGLAVQMPAGNIISSLAHQRFVIFVLHLLSFIVLSAMTIFFLHRLRDQWGKLEESHKDLKNEREKLDTIILSTREGIVVTDSSGKVVLVNPSAERIVGKTREKIVQEGFLSLLNDPDYLKAFLDGPKAGMPDTLVYADKVLNCYAATICNSDRQVVGSAALLRDVTEEKKLESQLRDLATTDGLTGLFNRRKFDEALSEELNRAKRYGFELSVIMLDVDHFKKFNDLHGHDQGDRVLQGVAREMRNHFRDIDLPCRYGGEEFCAIIPNTGPIGADMAAERLRKGIQDMVVDDLKVTISIGVAVYPHSKKDATTSELVKLADNALYQAKKSGRNCARRV